jgi:hypothetical protein
MTGESEYLRARDIARLTGVSIRTARRWIALVAKSELERLLSPTPDEAVEDIGDENENH